MKCMARVLAAKDNLAKIELNGKELKVGTIITVKWGRKRTNKQNSIYWLLLTWYVEEGGMDDMGYMTKEELHEAMKGRFLGSKKVTDQNGITYNKPGSTTDLTADEFMKYIEKIEHCIQEFCGISAAPFWTEYAQNASSQ